MSYVKAAWIILIGGFLCALSACASGSGIVRPGYDFKSVGKVAVLVTSEVGSPAQRKEIADLFAMHVLSRGYDVIDRANIPDITKEAEFQNDSGITSPEGRAKLAVHNISAVIVTNVTSLGEEISMTAKMVDVKSGDLLWTGEGTGSLKKWFGPAAGGLLGAGIGAVTGSVIGGGRGAIIGGIAGGAGGGVVGGALTPSDAKLLRKVIERTCESLPNLTAK